METFKYFFILLFMSTSCQHKPNQRESPLAIVVKLKTAESFADLEEARKYIDIESAY